MNINKLGLYSKINNINHKKTTPSQGPTFKTIKNQKLKADTINITHSKVIEAMPASDFAEIRLQITNQLQAPADTERVNSLKEQIQNGEYILDSIEISKSILK